jgi:hypothetical protein
MISSLKEVREEKVLGTRQLNTTTNKMKRKKRRIINEKIGYA